MSIVFRSTSSSSSSSKQPFFSLSLQCFELERLINRELRDLRSAAERARSSASAWATALAPLDDALRALGDSESFFGAAAREVEAVASALSREADKRRNREKAKEEEQEQKQEDKD